jgi:hypothetical protein
MRPRYGWKSGSSSNILKQSVLPLKANLSDPLTHVELAAALFVVWGVLTMLIGASTLALGVGAASLVTSAARAGRGQLAAGLTAATFVALAIIAVLWGLGHVIVGLQLRQRRAWARLGALMLGSLDLILLPYGTALGVYTLSTLLSEEGKRVFE